MSGLTAAGPKPSRAPSARRWLYTAVFVGVISLVPAGILALTAPNQSDALRSIGYLALWFGCGGLVGGTAIRVQQAAGWSRATAPLVSAVIASLVCGAIALILQLLDPGGYGLYSLLLIVPFALIALAGVTFIAVLVPIRLRRATVAVALVAAATLLVCDLVG